MSEIVPVSDQTKVEPEEEEDHVVCEICLSGNVYEGNEIMFCDKCNVAVHQGCYGVNEVPEGQWFCYPCAAGLDPSTTVCEVCPFMGGAYKPTYKTGKWAHSLCCQWIPEIYVSLEKNGKPFLNLANLDKKRFKLRCALCHNNKGACVQCCYGRCTTSAHPWCALKNPQGCTRRVVLNAEGATMWEIFCKTHAAAVSEPIKPKPKAKMSVPLLIDEPAPSQSSSSTAVFSTKKEYKTKDTSRFSDAGYNHYSYPHSSSKKAVMSMSHSKNFHSARLLAFKSSAKDSFPEVYTEQPEIDDADDYYFDESDEDGNVKPKALGKNVSINAVPSKKAGTDARGAGKKGAADSMSYPVLSMLEWPGISEGEPMDLDHFWNVVSGYYPEDHSSEWLKYMLADLQKPVVPQAVQSVLASNAAPIPAAEPTHTAGRGALGRARRGASETAAASGSGSGGGGGDEVFLTVPPLGQTKSANRAELVETAEELLSSIGGERERNVVFDEDKRADILRALNVRLNVIKGTSGGFSESACGDVKSEEGEEEFEVQSRASNGADFKQGGKMEETGVPCPLFLRENEFYTKPSMDHQRGTAKARGGVAATVEDIEYVDAKGLSALRSVFDGMRRFACEFKVHLPDTSEPAALPPALPAATNSRRGGKWHQVSLAGADLTASNVWAQENLIPVGEVESLEEITSAVSMREDAVPFLNISLESIEAVADSREVHLSDRVIIPRDEDNSLCRALRTDIHAYNILSEALQSRIQALVEKSNLDALSGKLSNSKVEWDMIDSLYTKQQIWKQVCTALNRGVRDQLPDFNKSEEEVLPASWQIQVQGRPAAAAEEEEAPEPHEDAVCMCCFDGTSVEGNRILFCDGCNATLHQICYGVPRIPEGDFFCDRCQYIQLLANDSTAGDFDYYHAKTAVMCCLCPLQHGGLKPTTDGRWVHLSCALWSPDAVIEDLTEMSPINLSRVPVQMPSDTDSIPVSNYAHSQRGFNASEAVELFRQNCLLTPLKEACMFCHLHGGRVQQCCYPSTPAGANSKCGKVFHPLCAWFEGLFMASVIEDPTFQGHQRAGQYPSGLTFSFLCNTHGPADRQAAIREEQQKLRCKYRINEDDLEQIPGQNRRKRKKPKKKPQQSMSISRMSGAENKDLNVDAYDEKCCAACMKPINPDVFLCGVIPSETPAWEIEEGVAEMDLSVPLATIAATSSSKTEPTALAEPFSPAAQLVTAAASEPQTALATNHAGGAVASSFSSSSSSEAPPSPQLRVATSLFPASPETDGLVRSASVTVPVSPPKVQLQEEAAAEPVEAVVMEAAGLVPDSFENSAVPVPVIEEVVEEFVPIDASNDAISVPATQSDTRVIASEGVDDTEIIKHGDQESSFVSVKTVEIGQGIVLSQVTDNTSSSEGLSAPPLGAPITALAVPVSAVAPPTVTFEPSLIEPVPSTEVAVAPTGTVISAAAAPPNAYKCKGCGLFVHKQCVVGYHPDEGADWNCDVCLLRQLSTEEPDIRCALCPRRGGYFKRTTDFKWAHLYCAESAPGQVRVVADGKIDIRVLPKENRKEKCCICNRKNGVCVQCSHVGCTAQFHPICAARSGKGCIRNRQGEKLAYCFAHLPEGVERMASGHWVDGFEVERLRYGLERARLILDVLVRREKHKKMICKAETELLSIRFHKMLDKAKKRKSRTGDDEVDLSDMSLYDTESEYYTDDDGEDGAPFGTSSKANGALSSTDDFVPLGETLGATVSRGEDMMMVNSTGEEANISATWIKRKEVRLPKRVIATFSGIDIDRKDVQREAGPRGFLKHYRDQVLKNSNAFRATTQIFSSALEEAEFGRSVGPKLKKHMAMPMDEFRAAMKTAPWLKLDGPAKEKPKSGRPAKKGYAYVDSPTHEEPGDAVEEDGEDDGAKSHNGHASSKVKPKFRQHASDLEESGSAAESATTPRRRGRPPRKQQTLDDWLPSAGESKSNKGFATALQDQLDDFESEDLPAKKKSKKQLREETEAAAILLAEQEAAAAEAEAALKKGRRGKRGEEAAPPPPPPVASPKKKLSKKEQAAADAAAAAEEEEEAKRIAAASKRIKKNKRALEEDLEDSAEELDTRTKKQRQRDEASAAVAVAAPVAALPVVIINKDGTTRLDETTTLVGKKTKDDAKKYSVAALFALERRLKDILNDIDACEAVEETAVPMKSTSKSKSKSKKVKPSEEGDEPRRLADAFDTVPYDVIPDYDSLVKKVVTLESMEQALSSHEYRSMGEFSDDFYTLLNNARTMTTPDSTIWPDSARLAEVFEESKLRNLTEPSCSKPRAPGREIISTKIGEAKAAAAVSSPSPRSPRTPRATSAGKESNSAKDGKLKWTCGCCKNLFSVSNWPAEFDIDCAYMPAPPESSAIAAPISSSMAQYSSGAWAASMIAATGSKEFKFPDNYVVNTRDNQDRRDRKEAALREQWTAALASTTKWRWLCAGCVESLGAMLIGSEVSVWWHDDALSYRGSIDAYDEASKCHRVMYEDNEWEFVNLMVEPACFGSTEEFALPAASRRKK